MIKLEDLETKNVIDLLIVKLMTNREDIKSRKQAKKIILNALCYNVSISAIMDQCDFLIDQE